MNYLTNEELQSSIIDVGYKYGLELHSNNRRIKNPNNIKSDKFIELLESIGYNDIIVTPPKTGNNTSSVFNAYEFNDGNRDRIITLADNISGRGTNQTRYQELSFLLMLSSYQRVSTENVLTNILNLDVYDKVLENGIPLDRDTVNDMVDFLNENPKWCDSILYQVKILDEYLDSKIPLYYIRDYNKFSLNMNAESLFKLDISSDIKWDADKWNPSDIWLIYNEKVPKFMSLEELNLYLYTSITECNGIVGISLKKGIGKLEEINFSENHLKLNSFKLGYGRLFTQNLYTLYDGENLNGVSITYRIFNANPNEMIRGESEQKKTDAAHGKVYLNYLQYLDKNSDIYNDVKNVIGKGVFKFNGNRWELTDDGKFKFNIIKESFKTMDKSDIIDKMDREFNVFLSESNFTDSVNKLMEDDNLTEFDLNKKISARFQTMVLGAYFCKLDKTKLHNIAINMLLYARSMAEWSSPHLKLQ